MKGISPVPLLFDGIYVAAPRCLSEPIQCRCEYRRYNFDSVGQS